MPIDLFLTPEFHSLLFR